MKDGESFKNPYKTDKVSISVDNAAWNTHMPGMISFFCYKSTGGYGSGAGCPMLKARFRVIVYYDPKSTTDITPKQAHKSIGGKYFGSSVDDAKADCGWAQATHGDWHTGTDAIDTDAAYTN